MVRIFAMKNQPAKRTATEISTIMRKVRGRDTSPEVALRKALWSRGLRYRLYTSELPGKPDIVIPSKRLVVFVDGDYWHGGQWRRRNLASLEDQFPATSSKSYWLKKIRRNMHRDCSATFALLSDGWTVLRFWESEIKKDLESCVESVVLTASDGAQQTRLSLLPSRTFAEFFAGIGLVRLALERQGWTVAYANDLDPKKKEMYDTNFQDSHLHLQDVHSVDPDSVPSVSLATASFPCNDLSLAGARAGLTGKQSSAFWGFASVIEAMGARRPPLILLENVPGFLTSNRGRDLEHALLALNRLGYTVDAFMLDALSFVPQSRQRLFVIGVADISGAPGDPSEPMDVEESEVRPKTLKSYIADHQNVKWNIRRLPSPPTRSASLEEILEDLPGDAPEWWNPERAAYLLDQMSPRHRDAADAMISASEWSYGAVFRRVRKGKSMAELRCDGVAGCLRTPRGGSGRQILFKAGYGSYFVRLLTPTECARLMGADDYTISAPLNQALFGFGDAVCAPAIEWIAKYYLNPVVNELIRCAPLGPLEG